MRFNKNIKYSIFLIFFLSSSILLTGLILKISAGVKPVTTDPYYNNLNLKTSATHVVMVEIDETNPAINWAAAKLAGICTGSGTAGDPYIIEDDVFTISVTPCLVIANSRKHFIVRNCSFMNPDMVPSIIVYNSTNGLFEQNQMWVLYQATIIDNCSQITIQTSNFTGCGYNLLCVDSNDLTITSNLFQYTHDTYDCITVDNCENCTFDSNDVVHGGNVGWGFYVDDSKDITIKDNTINDNNKGIYCENANNTIITGNDINENDGIGLYLYISNLCTILGNTIFNNTASGIIVENSNINTINSNTITYNNQGVELVAGSNNNEIHLNTINHNIIFGIYLSGNCQFNLIDSNNIENHNVDGIFLDTAHNNTISNNIVKTSGIYGIEVIFSNDNTFLRNTVFNSTMNGLSLFLSDDNDISENIAHFNYDNGIYMFLGTGNVFKKNTVYDNGEDGVLLNGGSNAIIEENHVYQNNQSGIQLNGVSSIAVLKNNVHNNDEHGIFLSGSNNNLISQNSANYNQLNGIHLESSDNNFITYNTANNNNNGTYLDTSDNNLIIGNILLNNGDCYNETNSAGNAFEDNVCVSTEAGEMDPFILGLIIGLIIGFGAFGVAIAATIFIRKKKRKD